MNKTKFIMRLIGLMLVVSMLATTCLTPISAARVTYYLSDLKMAEAEP